jgi:NAD(P)H-dependent flavin oxidoreductase YrpB (nitropropane dioxygenase family)
VCQRHIDVRARVHGSKVAALAGAAKHVLSHVRNGVDIIVAQGYEVGGHTGEVASIVLTPTSWTRSVPTYPCSGPVASAPVAKSPPRLRWARKGCGPARSGSAPRSTSSSTAMLAGRRRFTRATSSGTVRARIYTGKSGRLLKSRWTEAWAAEAPEPPADAAAEPAGR